MRLAVIGGKLQGVEACYLARRAGWEVVLVDKDPAPPARGLCDIFVRHDMAKHIEEMDTVIRDVDLIVPALEDMSVLCCLVDAAARNETCLAFDPEAYTLTSSKKRSDSLFCDLKLLVPQRWPECDPPVIVKPIGSSGSKGVSRITDEDTLRRFLQKNQDVMDQWVIQEYLTGPLYSLEIVGLDGHGTTLQTTALEMDAAFDCKRVTAPVDLPAALDRQFREMTHTLAAALRLNGVMDVEVVLHEDRLKVLEIDARLPSQTPTVVERSTGINMLELMASIFLDCRPPAPPPIPLGRGVVYEHIRVGKDHVEVSGEHIMAEANPLHVEEDFFWADLAITSFSASNRTWVATLIVEGETPEAAWKKRGEVIRAIMAKYNLSHYEDPVPEEIGQA